jgi:ribose 5-phosphate isomerase B
LGARMLKGKDAIAFVKYFITTRFEGGRHLKRIKKI